MNGNLFVVLVAAGMVYGTPLLIAGLGELFAERSGVLNLGVEGMMLVGACQSVSGCPKAWGAPPGSRSS